MRIPIKGTLTDDLPKQPAKQNPRIRRGLRLARLSDRFKHEETALRDLREIVWQELEAMYGGGTFPAYVDSVLQTALRHEQTALVCAKELRTREATLDLADKLTLLTAIAKSSDARDKCFKSLGLDPREATSGRNGGLKSNGMGSFGAPAIPLPSLPPLPALSTPPEPLADGFTSPASPATQPAGHVEHRPPDAVSVVQPGKPPA